MAIRGAIAMLAALPLLPVSGILLNGPPAMVFFMGATAFICGVMLFTWLCAIRFMPRDGLPPVRVAQTGDTPMPPSTPVAKRFQFGIRDLLCLTAVLFGMTVFIVSGFRCEAAERASRPGPLPAALYRQFAWELEAGLVCMTIGSLMWIRPVLDAANRDMSPR